MGKGLGIAALIFGLIGAGLGGYVFVVNTFFPPTGLTEMYFLITRTSTGTERIPASIQYGDSLISIGTHNVSVWGYSNIANQVCYRCALLVQTYT